MRNKTTLAVKVRRRRVSASNAIMGTFDWHAIQSAWVQGLRNHNRPANTKQLLTEEASDECQLCLAL